MNNSQFFVDILYTILQIKILCTKQRILLFLSKYNFENQVTESAAVEVAEPEGAAAQVNVLNPLAPTAV